MSKKDRRSAAAGKKSKTAVTALIFKLLALAVYIYSVFFWGSVTLIGIFGNSYDDFPPPAWVGIAMASGWAVITAAIVLTFLRKEITAFLLGSAGIAAYLAAAGWFVSAIRDLLETRDVTNDLIDMDREYIFRYFPIIASGVFLLVPAVMKAVRLIGEKRRRKREEQSAPVKSIID